MRIFKAILFLMLTVFSLELPTDGAEAEGEKIFWGAISLERGPTGLLRFPVSHDEFNIRRIDVSSGLHHYLKSTLQLAIWYRPTEVINFFKNKMLFKLDLYNFHEADWGGAQAPDPAKSLQLDLLPLAATVPSAPNYKHVGVGSWHFSFSQGGYGSTAEPIDSLGLFTFGDNPTLFDQWEKLKQEGKKYTGEFFYREGQGLAWLSISPEGKMEISFFFPHLGIQIDQEITWVDKIDIISESPSPPSPRLAIFSGKFNEPNQGMIQGMFYGEDVSEVGGTFNLSHPEIGTVNGAFLLSLSPD